MDVSTLVAEFGRRAGTPLVLQAGGTLALAFDNGLTVNIEHEAAPDLLHLYVVLGQEPADPAARATYYRALLIANPFGQAAGGGAFGIDDTTGEVLLTRTLPTATLDGTQLELALRHLVEAAGAWQEPGVGAPAPSQEPAALPSISYFDMRA